MPALVSIWLRWVPSTILRFSLHVPTSYLPQLVEDLGRSRVAGLSSASCSCACVHSDFASARLALAGSLLSTLSSSQRSQRCRRSPVLYKLVWHTAPKLARIESIEPIYTSGQLQFVDSWNREYPELIEQFIHFPLAAHRRRDRADQGV